MVHDRMIVTAREHLDHARADLRRSDDRPEADRERQVDAARLQQRQQVRADDARESPPRS